MENKMSVEAVDSKIKTLYGEMKELDRQYIESQRKVREWKRLKEKLLEAEEE